MDLFRDKNIAPMLIARMQEPFDDPNWIYELKLDGSRCIAYLEQDRVILVKGVPDFYELQKREMMSDPFKIRLGAAKLPASFVAYDCLQAGDRVLLDVPLIERKQVLSDLIREEEQLAVSRYIEEKGAALFELTKQRELEGVVAKRKDSLYQLGKRTKEWVKFKRMADEDFVICGYQPGDMIKLILAEYENGEIKYAGTVTLGVRRDIVEVLHEGLCPFKLPPKGKEQVVWCIPERVCTVEYMPNTKDALRQAVFKGIRDDIRGS